jgi:hypothetical protein
MSKTPAKLTFGIPLRATNDLAERERLWRVLTATIRSVYNQTDPAFRLVVACNRVPDLDVDIDDRLEFVIMDHQPAVSYLEGNIDAGAKRWQIAHNFVNQGGGYLMFLDADDLVSKRLVEFVGQTRHPWGYIFEHGYALDAELNRVLPLPRPGSNDVPFHQICGSSTVVRLLPEDFINKGDQPTRYSRLFRAGHTSVAAVSAEEGRDLLPLPFAGAVYVVGASITQSKIRGREDPGFGEGRRRWQSVFAREGLAVSAIADEFGIGGGCYGMP